MKSVQHIRHELAHSREREDTRNGTVEIRHAMFVASEDSIFGTPNQDYIKAEIEWYEAEDRNVFKLFEIYGKPVAIWDKIKDKYGLVNSQYGCLVYSKGQYVEVLFELQTNPTSRQAVMYYAPGHMTQFVGRADRQNGITDHVCTTSVQYFIVDGRLDVQVNMRSNDAVYGYANDLAWQRHLQSKLAKDLAVRPGNIVWCAGSLHVYERHYHLIDEWIDNA